MRLLWWLLLGLAVVWLVKGLRRPADPSAGAQSPPERPPTAPQPPAAKPGPVPPQLMVQCARCGVHLPARDAHPGDGHSYCSAAHRDAGPQAADRG